MAQRVVPVLGAFGHLAQLDQRAAHAIASARALLLEPMRELARRDLFTGSLAEHRVCFFEVMADTLDQAERGAALHQIDAQHLAQTEQALAQVVARRVGILVGPQQGGQARTRGRTLERQPGQQRGVARRQRHAAAIGADEGGRVGKLELHGAPMQ